MDKKKHIKQTEMKAHLREFHCNLPGSVCHSCRLQLSSASKAFGSKDPAGHAV